MGDGFRIATWLIEPQLNTVSRNGATTHLEPKVMEVLVCLARRTGEPVAKEEILQTVWPDTFVTDDGLKRSISELRRVFEDDVRDPRIIQTIPKRGYRLLVPVEPVNGAGAQGTETAQPNEESHKAGLNWRALALLSGGMAAFLLILLGVYLTSKERWLGKTAAPQIHSIAVLPLQNLSGDLSQEYFADGMTDALITDLAQIGSLRVISRTSSMQYRQTTQSLPQIARELSVDGIVEGSIQRSGDRVRITAQLIHSSSDMHLWANTYEGSLADFFDLERNVTQDIARQVQARLMSQNQTPQAQSKPTNPKALDAYLQGNYYLSRYGNGSGDEEVKRAAEFFQQAIDADPNFSRAYFGLANAHSTLPRITPKDAAITRKAEDAALALDQNSPEARQALADRKWSHLDWAGTEKEFQTAMALYPNHVGLHDDFCSFLSQLGRLDEARKECQVAQEVDPGNDHLSEILYLRGDYDHAIAILHLMIARHPDDGGLHYHLYECSVQKQNYTEAVPELVKTLTLFGESGGAAEIQDAYAAGGYRAAMQQWTRVGERLAANRQIYLPVNLADAYAVLGEKDRALYWLDQAFEHRDMISAGSPATSLGVDPMLTSIRSDPRFENLVHRLGLPQ